jgi:excisionase family DNA binding protein
MNAKTLVADGVVSVNQAMQFTGLRRSYLHVLMNRGELRFVKLGKRRMLPRTELVRLLSSGLVEKV